MSPNEQASLGMGRKIAAFYLIVSSIFGLALLVFGTSNHYAGFPTESAAYRAGNYTREATLAVAGLVVGILILRRHRRAWAHGIVVLVINGIYGGRQFAWGFADGQPTAKILIWSYVVVGLCELLWISLLLERRQRPASLLPPP